MILSRTNYYHLSLYRRAVLIVRRNNSTNTSRLHIKVPVSLDLYSFNPRFKITWIIYLPSLTDFSRDNRHTVIPFERRFLIDFVDSCSMVRTNRAHVIADDRISAIFQTRASVLRSNDTFVKWKKKEASKFIFSFRYLLLYTLFLCRMHAFYLLGTSVSLFLARKRSTINEVERWCGGEGYALGDELFQFYSSPGVVSCGRSRSVIAKRGRSSGEREKEKENSLPSRCGRETWTIRSASSCREVKTGDADGRSNGRNLIPTRKCRELTIPRRISQYDRAQTREWRRGGKVAEGGKRKIARFDLSAT